MTKHPRKSSLGKLAAGALVAVGMAVAAGSPAMADNWKHHGHGNGDWNGHGNKHWQHGRWQPNYGHGGYYYYQPQPIYVQPQPVYVQPQPVYVAPPPPVYYPAPVYRRPEINIVFPLDFD